MDSGEYLVYGESDLLYGDYHKVFEELNLFIFSHLSFEKLEKMGEIRRIVVKSRKFSCNSICFNVDTLYYDQSRFYKGKSIHTSDVLFTDDGRCLYKGDSNSPNDAILTYDGMHIYKGKSEDVLYTFDGSYLRRGKSRRKTIMTFDGKHVYKGRSTSMSDILYIIEGDVSIAELVMLVLGLENELVSDRLP